MKDASVTSLLCAIHTFSAHSLEYCSSENVQDTSHKSGRSGQETNWTIVKASG